MEYPAIQEQKAASGKITLNKKLLEDPSNQLNPQDLSQQLQSVSSILSQLLGQQKLHFHCSFGCFRWHKCSLQSVFIVNYVDLGQIKVQGQCTVTKSASPTHRATRAFSCPPARHRMSARAKERHLVL